MTADTICAISTPPGVGGIAVARVSGHDTFNIVKKIWKGRNILEMESHTAHLGTILSADGSVLDQAVLTLYRNPASFTGEDVIEIAVHGSRFVQRELLSSLVASGARIADPGEFTRRAFVAGKMDLAEAEAVADVIASNSRAAHRIAVNQMRGGFSRHLATLREHLVDLASLLELELDFSEEDVEFASRKRLRKLATEVQNEISRLERSFTAGNAIKEGIPVAIVGATNAGKSSLLNRIIGDERAIVSDIHGTTRDTIEETIEIGDYLFRFIDTAGLRATDDEIEQIGIERSHRAIEKARIVIAVIDSTLPIDKKVITDASLPLNNAMAPGYLILALNKTDILSPDRSTELENKISQLVKSLNAGEHALYVAISAQTGKGIEQLLSSLLNCARTDNGDADEDILVTNARHASALSNARESVTRVISGLDTNLPGDLIAQDLRETLSYLASITGEIPSTEILASIFSRFCIGK